MCITQAKNSSFKLRVNVSEFDQLFDISVWLEGISIRRFRFKSMCSMS